MMKIDKVKQGKQNKRSGAVFELKVRKDLEKKGWIVSKWMNNLDYPKNNINLPSEEREDMKLIPARRTYRGPGIPMAIGTGFPDFIVFRYGDSCDCGHDCGHIMGVEAKSNGKLDKLEKEKCEWLIKNEIFHSILIASKGSKRGSIRYEEVRGL